MRQLLEQSFHHALQATHPKRLTQAQLPQERPALVIAVGKAALTMLEAATERYPGVPFIAVTKDDGQAVPPVDGREPLRLDGREPLRLDGGEPLRLDGGEPLRLDGGEPLRLDGGEVLLASHPTPDRRSVQAGEKVLAAVGKLGPGDLVLLLISGGGSSLLCAPWGIGLEQKQALTQALLRSGADIQEMNALRKHLSRLKGGRLAAATPARVLALYLSDVPGDDLSVIASGPTVPDASTFSEALAILDKYGLEALEVRRQLKLGQRGELPESPKPGEGVFARVENRLIGSNQHLLEATRTFWQNQGYSAVILSDRLQGEAREMARFHAALVEAIRIHHTPFKPPVVLISGGEATVTVRGSGKGGRSQEFMLALLHYLGSKGVYGLAADSDGIDGNTEAAGAFLEPDSYTQARTRGLEVRKFLERNDAYGFFQAMGGHLMTGPTQNNLNDFRVLIV